MRPWGPPRARRGAIAPVLVEYPAPRRGNLFSIYARRRTGLRHRVIRAIYQREREPTSQQQQITTTDKQQQQQQVCVFFYVYKKNYCKKIIII